MMGATVPGPHHLQQGQPNQDCWGGYGMRRGHVLVVCDGVGSCPRSRQGSRAACRAAREVMRDASDEVTAASFRDRLVERWLEMVRPGIPSACATTCLVAARWRSGRLLVGGIGDGLAAVVRGGLEARVEIVDGGRGEFGETAALCGRGEEQWWTMRDFDDSRGQHRVLLATDGVANDLVLERLPSLVNWLVERHGADGRRRWRSRMRGMLGRWPTPGSSDDRTLAVMWTMTEGAHG